MDTRCHSIYGVVYTYTISHSGGVLSCVSQVYLTRICISFLVCKSQDIFPETSFQSKNDPQWVAHSAAIQSPYFICITKTGVINIDSHDDVIKWKQFRRYWPFVRGIHRSPVNCPHKGQWRGALMFSLICARLNGWVNNGEAGDLRRHPAHYNVTVMHGCGRDKKHHIVIWCTAIGYKLHLALTKL